MYFHPDSAELIISNLLKACLETGYKVGIISAYETLGIIADTRGSYEKAMHYFTYTLALLRAGLPDRYPFFATVYNNIAIVFTNQNRFEEAMQAYRKAIYYAQKQPSRYKLTLYLTHNFGVLLSDLGYQDKAIPYFEQAMTMADNTKDSFAAMIAASLGIAYERKGDPDNAERFLDSAISMARDKHGHITPYQAGTLYFALTHKAGLLLKKKQQEKAIALLSEIKEMQEQYHLDTFHQRYALMNIGIVFLSEKNYEEAERYLTQANSFAAHDSKLKLSVLPHLSELYHATGRYTQAFELRKQYEQLKDSIRDKEAVYTVAELETQYRTTEKDKELALQQNKLYQKNFWIFGITSCSVLLVGLLSGIFIYRNKRQKAVKELEYLRAMVEGEEKERSRLSKDLHDGVNSQLTAIKLHVAALKNKQQDEHIQHSFADIESMLVRASGSVRRVAYNLAPDQLEKNGLSYCIEDFCTGLLKDSDIEADMQIYENVDSVEPQLALSIYRIIQELVHNIVKHAKASKVTLLLVRNEHTLQMVVEDNGTGMDESIVREKRYGLGLNSVAERVGAHQGTMSITKDPNHKGTVVDISFPLERMS